VGLCHERLQLDRVVHLLVSLKLVVDSKLEILPAQVIGIEISIKNDYFLKRARLKCT